MRRGHSVLVLEREGRPGGRLHDEVWEGARIALGAEFATRSYTRLMAYLDELGLAGRLEPAAEGSLGAVRRDGAWHHVDYSSLPSAVRFSGIGWLDRLSLATGMAGLLPWAGALDLGDLTRTPRLATRAVTSVFTGAAARFLLCPPYEILLGCRQEELSMAVLAVGVLQRSRPLTLPDGMSALALALAARCEMSCGVAVTRVDARGREVLVETDGPHAYRPRAAILATTAPEAARLWHGAPSETSDFLVSVPYARTDWAYLRTDRPYAPRDPRGRPLTMQLIPPGARRGRDILGYLGFMRHRAASGGLLLAGAGPGAGGDRLDDEALGDVLQSEVEAMHPDLEGAITARRLVRFDRYVPIFSPAHVPRLREFRRRLGPGPVDVAGDYLNAPWMEGALRAGEAAADRVGRFLTTTP